VVLSPRDSNEVMVRAYEQCRKGRMRGNTQVKLLGGSIKRFCKKTPILAIFTDPESISVGIVSKQREELLYAAHEDMQK